MFIDKFGDELAIPSTETRLVVCALGENVHALGWRSALRVQSAHLFWRNQLVGRTFNNKIIEGRKNGIRVRWRKILTHVFMMAVIHT